MKKYLDILRERLLHTCKCYWSTSPIFYLLYIETTSSPITHLCFIEPVSVCGSTSVPPCIPTQGQHQPLWLSEVFVASLLFLSSVWSLIYLFPLSLPRKPYSSPCWLSSLPHNWMHWRSRISCTRLTPGIWLGLKGRWRFEKKPYYLVLDISKT